MSMDPSLANWVELFTHMASLSLLAIGGAITTAPDMHRFLVTEHGWLSDAQFTSSIALSQAAPGPNVLFVALLGWNVGLNAAGGPSVGAMAWLLALLGMLVCMVAIILPSSIVSYTATRWAHANRQLRSVRAFKAAMAPIVIALLMATGWLLMSAYNEPTRDGPLWALTFIATLLVWKTKLHLLWLIAGGGVVGALGWV